MNKPSIAAVAALCLSMPYAQAQGAGHFRFEHQYIDLKFNSDMTYTHVADVTVRALDEVGAQSIGQQYFGYQDGREKGTVELAETISADGKATPVTADNIKQQNGVVGGVTMPDRKVIQVTFPKLAVGDAIHYRYRYEALKVDGGSSDFEDFDRALLHDDVRVTLSYPKDLPLQYSAHEVGDATTSGDDRSVREWHFHNTQTVMPDYDTVNGWRLHPYIMVSTYPDWKAVADSYQVGAEPQAKVTDEVSSLAAEITKDSKDEREQARALYDWVRKNIRYVASYIGDGGWVPHDTHSILANRFGDCKDHATLLEALLEARGISASQVLISANTDSYVLPELPMRDFNHAITYIPSLDLFLDSTADMTPFGLLPEMDAGKPVLVTKQFKDVSHTPVITPEQYKVTRQVHIKVHPDGSGTRDAEITSYGRAAVVTHQFLSNIGTGKEDDWVKKFMADQGWVGTGKLNVEKHDGSDIERYRFDQTITNYLYQPEAGEVSFSTGIQGPIGIAAILKRYSETTRTADARCDPFSIEDVIDIDLPREMKVVYVPKDISLHDDIVNFDAHYQKIGNTYRMTRSWGFHTARSTCSPAEYLALRPTVEKVRKALNSTLVYVPRKG